jgi:hypothetical protein
MSATPREIKEALKQALKSVKGLRVTDYQPDQSAQSFLDRMIAYDDGVREAIEEDRTLGGVVQDCIVLSAGNIVSITANDTTYLTVDFQVQVYG